MARQGPGYQTTTHALVVVLATRTAVALATELVFTLATAWAISDGAGAREEGRELALTGMDRRKSRRAGQARIRAPSHSATRPLKHKHRPGYTNSSRLTLSGTPMKTRSSAILIVSSLRHPFVEYKVWWVYVGCSFRVLSRAGHNQSKTRRWWVTADVGAVETLLSIDSEAIDISRAGLTGSEFGPSLCEGLLVGAQRSELAWGPRKEAKILITKTSIGVVELPAVCQMSVGVCKLQQKREVDVWSG